MVIIVVVVIGTSQIGRVVGDMVTMLGERRELRFVAEEAGASTVDGAPVIGTIAELEKVFSGTEPSHVHVIITLESPSLAARVTEELAKWSPRFGALHDHTAVVSSTAEVGQGAVILPHATVCSGAVIGRHVVVGVGAVVGCDVRVEDFARIPDGAHIPAGATFSAR